MRVLRSLRLIIGASLVLSACAGREPKPVQTVQASDNDFSCLQIREEIAANNALITELSGEEGGKVAQNIAAGVAGLLIWPLWFAMDFEDAAGKEGQALQARNEYLARLYTDNNCVNLREKDDVVANAPSYD